MDFKYFAEINTWPRYGMIVAELHLYLLNYIMSVYKLSLGNNLSLWQLPFENHQGTLLIVDVAMLT